MMFDKRYFCYFDLMQFNSNDGSDSYRKMLTTKVQLFSSSFNYKSFLLNFTSDIQNGITAHNTKRSRATVKPKLVPKNSLNIAPV